MTRAEENRRHSATAGPSANAQFTGRNQDNPLAPPAPALLTTPPMAARRSFRMASQFENCCSTIPTAHRL
jgi:hypothetical protein